MTTNGHAATNGHSGVTLYTSHSCPYAQRAHITLDELDLKYEEVLIDLSVPRPQWLVMSLTASTLSCKHRLIPSRYLDINPRGLVPSIKYSVPGLLDEEILTESGIVIQFLAESFPSHLLPASKESPTSALTRARIAFFQDTWTTKIGPLIFPIITNSDPAQKEAKVDDLVGALKKEIEPLLANAKPFFGGSTELTLAEVFAGPFLLRLDSYARDGELAPHSLSKKINALPNFGKWKKEVTSHQTVKRVYDEKKILEGTKARIAKMQAAK